MYNSDNNVFKYIASRGATIDRSCALGRNVTFVCSKYQCNMETILSTGIVNLQLDSLALQHTTSAIYELLECILSPCEARDFASALAVM